MESSLASQSALGKRKKRDDADPDYENSLFLSGDECNDDNDSEDVEFGHRQAQDSDDDFGDGTDDLDRDSNAIYHERKEAFPQHPAFDPELPKLAENLVSIVKGTIEVIEANPCGTEHVQNNLSKAYELFTVPKPEQIKIALLGDTGTGQSSSCQCFLPLLTRSRQEFFAELNHRHSRPCESCR